MEPKRFISTVMICFLISFSSNGQVDGDTLFYEIKPEMIHQTEVYKSDITPEYYIHVQIKEDYRKRYAQLTEENIGNFLAVKYQGEVVAPSLPTIQARIPSGRFRLGPYKNKKEAKEVRKWILDRDG